MNSNLPPRTFNQQFEEIAQRFHQRIAFRLKTPEGYHTVSYREAFKQSKSVAFGLLGMGLQQGSRVAILSENRPEWVVAYLGIYLAGMIAVPLDTQISPAEWRRLLDDSEAQTVFASDLLLPKLKEAVKDSQPPRHLISFTAGSPEGDPRTQLGGLIDWAANLMPPPSLPECQPTDVVTIIYTSGTTGAPKGVMLTQSNIVSEIAGIIRVISVDENEALLCLLPLQHVLASVINVLLPLYIGAQVVFADTLKRSEILQAMEEAGITVLATVPQFLYLLHNRIKDELSKKSILARKLFRGMLLLNRFTMRFLKLNLGKRLFPKVHRTFGSKLRLFVSGGSSFDPAVAQDFYDMGFTILQGYGLTETTGAATVTRIESNIVGSVGSALPGVSVKILAPDETGVGEVLISGPVVMKGYYKNVAGTEESVKNGWFHSGDLGRLDSEANLFITGRKKEVIVLPNGKNIYPDELETHYLQCPYIQEIAVIGIATAGEREKGERLHAVVVPNFDYLKAKKIANAREILRDEIASLSNQLPKYKRLMSYQIQKDPLPRTTTRKIKRLALKKMIESGQFKTTEDTPTTATVSPEDQALMESAVGREVLSCLRETYQRDMPIDVGMNLELDLGFDSMERVELLTSLEQTLNLNLPEDFGAEIFTVRELIFRLEQLTGVTSGSRVASRQSWKSILSEESLEQEEAMQVRFAGSALSLFKFVCLRLVYYLLFRTFLRLKTNGLEHLPKNGPFLICPNHLSYIDPFVVFSTLPYRSFSKVFFVGYSQFFSGWLMKLLAKLANIIPVDPDAHLLRAMKAGAYGLRKGYILCIFPEGGRSFDGSLQEFKKGAAILANEMAVPMVPVAIQGTYEVWPRDSWRIRPHKVKVTYGKTITPGLTSEIDPYQADTDTLHNAVSQLITQMTNPS